VEEGGWRVEGGGGRGGRRLEGGVTYLDNLLDPQSSLLDQVLREEKWLVPSPTDQLYHLPMGESLHVR
jgi:hypothetical protein